MSKSNDIGASKSILEYLNKQNRPYSAIDIFNNLHKEIGKTAVVRVLEDLAADKKIVEKTYGKQKIYYSDQSQFSSKSEVELRAMDEEINNLTTTIKDLQQQTKTSELTLAALKSSLTTEELATRLEELTSENNKLEAKLVSLKSSEQAVTEEEKNAVCKQNENYVKEWRKRKRMATDILNAILENYPKTKKTLYEEVGIETDEELNISLPK